MVWTDWSITGPEGTPTQSNSYDCGVFLCMAITHVALKALLQFTQDDMPQCRRHIAQRIISNKYYNSDTGQHNMSPSTVRRMNKTPTPTSKSCPKSRPSPTNPAQPRRKALSSHSSSSSKLQRKRRHHAATHRPLSPVHLARLPLSPRNPAGPHPISLPSVGLHHSPPPPSTSRG